MFEPEYKPFDIHDEHEERVHYDKSLHNKYHNMRKRCLDKNNKDYVHYGGRGITICDEWLDDKYAFFQWSMENGYELGLEIDRTNNDLGYSPDNCRYVTKKQNRNNRRDSK